MQIAWAAALELAFGAGGVVDVLVVPGTLEGVGVEVV